MNDATATTNCQLNYSHNKFTHKTCWVSRGTGITSIRGVVSGLQIIMLQIYWQLHLYYYCCFMALCPGQPGWAGTRRNIHLLTSILIINHPLSATAIYCNSQHPPCSIYVHNNLFAQSLSKFSLVYPFVWHLHFILHTFLHPIIVFFLQHMPITSQPVLL